MQTGMHASEALIPLKGAAFRTGTTMKLKDGGSAKRSQTVRDDGVTGSKSRTSEASARRACQRSNIIFA